MLGRVSWFLLVGAGSAAGYSKERSSTPRLDLHLVPGGAPFWLLSGPDPSKRSPAALLGFPAAGPLFSFPKSVPAACVQTCFVSLLVDPFCPLSCPDPSKKRSRRLCLAAVSVSAVKILLQCLHPPHICKACLALLECQPSHVCHSCRSRGCLSVGSLFRENHCSSKGLGRNVLFDFLSFSLSKAVPLSLSLCLFFCAAKKGSSSWEKMQV